VKSNVFSNVFVNDEPKASEVPNASFVGAPNPPELVLLFFWFDILPPVPNVSVVCSVPNESALAPKASLVSTLPKVSVAEIPVPNASVPPPPNASVTPKVSADPNPNSVVVPPKVLSGSKLAAFSKLKKLFLNASSLKAGPLSPLGAITELAGVGGIITELGGVGATSADTTLPTCCGIEPAITLFAGVGGGIDPAITLFAGVGGGREPAITLFAGVRGTDEPNASLPNPNESAEPKVSRAAAKGSCADENGSFESPKGSDVAKNELASFTTLFGLPNEGEDVVVEGLSVTDPKVSFVILPKPNPSFDVWAKGSSLPLSNVNVSFPLKLKSELVVGKEGEGAV